MSSDLRFWNRPPGFVFGDDDYFVGGIEDWAVQLIQEQGGYYNESGENGEPSDNWVDVQLDDEFSQRDAWRLACRALGLGKEAEASAFVTEVKLPHALFHPSRLYGRMQAVTPRMAAEVLHSVVEGLVARGPPGGGLTWKSGSLASRSWQTSWKRRKPACRSGRLKTGTMQNLRKI